MSRRLLYRPRRLPRRIGQGRRRHRFLPFKLLIIIALVMTVLVMFQVKLSPIVKQLAMARINYISGKIINDAVNEQLDKGTYLCDELVHLEKDTEGHITALRTDITKINRLKAAVIGTVMEKMNNIDPAQLKIPLGNIFGAEILSGRGPRIPITIVPVGTAEAKFASAFSAAGINQTRHRIIIEVTVHVGVILPGVRTGTDVTSQVNVAETIIVGVVPNTYTYLEDTGMTPLDIYGNFDLTGSGTN